MKKNSIIRIVITFAVLLVILILNCEDQPIDPDLVEWPTRYEKIPSNAVKMTRKLKNSELDLAVIVC